MKIKKSHLIKLIREQLINEMPTQWDPYQSTVDRRMYKNPLKDTAVSKYPSQREIQHEMMRINTLWLKSPIQYDLRLTKITNPQKFVTAYYSILAWLKRNPTYRKAFEKTLDKVRWYLRKNHLDYVLVGKGGKSTIN